MKKHKKISLEKIIWKEVQVIWKIGVIGGCEIQYCKNTGYPPN